MNENRDSLEEKIFSEDETRIKPSPDVKKPSLKQKILRKSLAVFILLMIGALLVAVFVVRPLQKRIAEQNEQIRTLEQSSSTVDSLNAQLVELNSLKAKTSVLSAKSEILEAHVLLLNEDKIHALSALKRASQYLEEIDEKLDPTSNSKIKNTLARLSLATAGVEESDSSVYADIDILIKNIKELELLLSTSK